MQVFDRFSKTQPERQESFKKRRKSQKTIKQEDD